MYHSSPLLSSSSIFRADSHGREGYRTKYHHPVNCHCFPRRVVKKPRKSSCRGEWVWYGVNVDYEYQQIGTTQQRYPQPFKPQQGPKVRNETILQGTQ